MLGSYQEETSHGSDRVRAVRPPMGSDRLCAVLVSSGCNSHPATGSLQPVAIGAAEVSKPSEPPRRMSRSGDAASRQAVTRLGTIPARRMGDRTEDGEEPTQACTRSAVGMVPEKSAPFDQGAAPQAHGKAARPLRVLRDYWKLLQPPGISGGSSRDLETPAFSASPRQTDDVAPFPPSGEALQYSPRPLGPRFGGSGSAVMR
jgi:hypothetical protein